MGRIGYCSACDRNVPVILRTKADLGGTPAPGDAEALVCLDYGVRCTGALCPLFSVDAASVPTLHGTAGGRERGRRKPDGAAAAQAGPDDPHAPAHA